MDNLISLFFDMPRAAKRAITLIFDLSFTSGALFMAFFIRLGEDALKYIDKEVFWLAAALVPCTILVWIKLGLYRAIIRYLDVKVLSSIFWGSIASVLLLVSLSFVLRADLPRSIPFIYFTLVLIFVGGSRLLVRGLINAQKGNPLVQVAIYGAGSSGRQLCLSLQNGSEYDPVFFVDDNVQLHGTTTSGVRVYSPDELEELVKKFGIEKILLAMPSASASQKKNILNEIQALHVEILTIPGSADLVSGRVNISQLRGVDINDLLGREPVTPNMALFNKCLHGKVVMVTGAGGSIGSELCRQIAGSGPRKLILLEQSEFNLYSIERELSTNVKVNLVPILGSALDEHLVDNIMSSHSVDTVYHAAAYKHVPLVEQNITVGIRNNVWGTRVLAEAALRHKVDHFVLISTDKAVRPTNIMGASKRIAEMVIQDLAERTSHTVFSMVRFGNVLGSSGSVVPLFRSQIENGGPVTVTHPDITRYFMTIPEAASLVIQAGAMAKGGEVFVLDMGEPVKISELAEKMIHLMGLEVQSERNLNGDINIEYTGLRPGEKLYEELLIGGNVKGTEHPRIMRAIETSLSSDTLRELLTDLSGYLLSRDIDSIRNLLVKAKTGYNPEGSASFEKETNNNLGSNSAKLKLITPTKS